MKYSTEDTFGDITNNQTISCPSCGHEFELSDALTGPIKEHLRQELLEEVNRREKELQKKQDNLKLQQETLTKARETLDEEVQRKLQQGLREAEAKAGKKAEAKFADQLKELQDSLKERDDSIKIFRANELELRKKKHELEKQKEEFDLKLLSELEKATLKVRQETEQKVIQQQRLKDLEKDKLISDLKADLEEAKRKADQRSMQLQGEVLELDFEDQLQRTFLHDNIQPVPKGVCGADLVQNIRTPVGAECGAILWETKNTKSWSHQWIPKLKDDIIAMRAHLAILVSTVLPPGIKAFGSVDGVWVCDPASALALATVLREQLIAVHCERQSQVGKNEKMEILYQYLAGPEFRQKIEGIVEAFTSMQAQIHKERRAMEKQWKLREKQIARVLKNTAGLYGDMQGIIGGKIADIPALELDSESLNQLPENVDSAEEEDDEF